MKKFFSGFASLIFFTIRLLFIAGIALFFISIFRLQDVQNAINFFKNFPWR